MNYFLLMTEMRIIIVNINDNEKEDENDGGNDDNEVLNNCFISGIDIDNIRHHQIIEKTLKKST